MTDMGAYDFDQEGNDDLLTDDNFHEPETGEWWEHETLWF